MIVQGGVVTTELRPSKQRKKKAPFESLYVYHLAKKLADMSWTSTEGWPVFEKREIGEPLIRAADTLRLNVEHSLTSPDAINGREYARKARSSLFEIRHLLKKAFRADVLSEEEADGFLMIIEPLGSRINRIVDLLGVEWRSSG